MQSRSEPSTMKKETFHGRSASRYSSHRLRPVHRRGAGGNALAVDVEAVYAYPSVSYDMESVYQQK